MELPYQTYERVTGKKWTGGSSTDIQAAYKQYGITAPAGSAEANLALQKALGGAKSSVPNQGGIVQDTTAQNTKDATTAAKVDEKVGAITGTPTPGTGTTPGTVPVTDTTQIVGKDGKTYKTTPPAGMVYNLPPLTDGKKYVYDQNGRPMVQDSTGAIVNDPMADQEYEANVASNKQSDDYIANYDQYKTGLDTAHAALIDRITQMAKVQKDAMTVLNKRSLGAKKVQGYRTGTAEYASEIDTGILKAEEQEGIARLAEIDANMNLAIAQAVSAKTAKDFDLVNKRLELVSELQKNKEQTIQNIYKTYVDNAKLIADKTKAVETEQRAQRDQALQELSVSAPELVKQYDSYKTQAEKDTWLNLMVKKTGLDKDILLGSLEKIRLDVRNKESIIDKRETPTEKAASITKQRDDDIAAAILDFQDQMKTKGWAGVNPQAYEYYKSEIRRLYGAAAVLEFDKAIRDAGMAVDYEP